MGHGDLVKRKQKSKSYVVLPQILLACPWLFVLISVVNKSTDVVIIGSEDTECCFTTRITVLLFSVYSVVKVYKSRSGILFKNSSFDCLH